MSETIDILVTAGKATAGPPLGPALGPTGIDVGAVVGAINEKTSPMAGMQVPVKVHIDAGNKSFEIEIGTPPTSALIKKDLNLEKGSGKASTEMVADMPIDNIIKIAKVKVDGLLANDVSAAVREIIGTCQSLGIEVEGMMPRDAIAAIKEGKWKGKISGKKALEEHSAAELAAKQAEMQAVLDEKHKAEAAQAAAEEAEKPKEEAPAEEVKPAEGDTPNAEGKPTE